MHADHAGLGGNSHPEDTGPGLVGYLRHRAARRL